VRMGIRVLQRCPVAVGLRGADSPPRANIEKSFMLSDGRVRLEAVLDRAHYRQGEPVHVKLSIHNHSRKTVRRIKVKTIDISEFRHSFLGERGGGTSQLDSFLSKTKSRRTRAKEGNVAYFIAFYELTSMFRW
jgi:uncharacterized protein (DUF58 family)